MAGQASDDRSAPFVSVITVVRNPGIVLHDLHASLAAQNVEFEWVVWDGLSADGTVAWLADVAARTPWLAWHSQADSGIYDALNKAIALARGRYYVVAGADDTFAPDALERFARAARETDADVVLASVRKGRNVIGGFHPRLAWLGHSKAFRGSHSVGMLIRRDLHGLHGTYSPRFPLLADGYFLKKLLGDPRVRFASQTFVAGQFGEEGVSSRRKLQTLAETWQIQMLTERSPVLQTLLFLGKVLVRLPAVCREMRLHARTARAPTATG